MKEFGLCITAAAVMGIIDMLHPSRPCWGSYLGYGCGIILGLVLAS